MDDQGATGLRLIVLAATLITVVVWILAAIGAWHLVMN